MIWKHTRSTTPWPLLQAHQKWAHTLSLSPQEGEAFPLVCSHHIWADTIRTKCTRMLDIFFVTPLIKHNYIFLFNMKLFIYRDHQHQYARTQCTRILPSCSYDTILWADRKDKELTAFLLIRVRRLKLGPPCLPLLFINELQPVTVYPSIHTVSINVFTLDKSVSKVLIKIK